MRTIVVGAGLAGLSAAAELEAHGGQVEVLEARERVGGRVWSRQLENGAVIEMGAEFMLPGNTVIRELAAELGLELWDKGVRYGRREPRGGQAFSDAALSQALGAVGAELARDLGSAMIPAAEFLDGLEIDAGAREYILARAEISAASSATQVPAGDLLGVAHVDDLPAPSIAGGNQQLALGLAARMRGSVRLLTPVRHMAWSADRVRVATDEGALDADAAVIAVPAAVLGAITFEPALPEPLAAALGAVGYGQAAKLFVPLATPPEPRAVMSVPERYWSWTATGMDDRPQPVISAFAGSPDALERLAIAGGPRHWLESLRALRPELELGLAEDAILSTWADDEWVRAAYSVSPGPEATAAMTGPCGPLAFAGEHTAGEFSGLMEGALRSGRRAAGQLLTRPPQGDSAGS